MTLENGIYFGLSFEDYNKIERLSKSRIKQILISPADFWADSWLNPNPKKLTPNQERHRRIALLLGKAYHCARLESDEFDARFVREISQADFADDENFLQNGTQIEAALADLEQPKKSKDDDGVLGQARRLSAAGYEGPIWHIELAKWEADKGERLAVPADAYDQIVIDMERMRDVPEVNDALSNGFAEVVILYTCADTGLPMKARLDWLRADGWVEFKSFSNPNGKTLEQCLIDAIRFNRYYIDIAAYHEAVEAVRLANDDLSIFVSGNMTMAHAQELVEHIQADPMPLPNRIVFQQKDGVPNILSRELQLFERTAEKMVAADGGKHVATRPTMLMMKARAEIKNAKRTFIGYSEIYERGEPWLPFDPHREITDFDFHQNWLESL